MMIDSVSCRVVSYISQRHTKLNRADRHTANTPVNLHTFQVIMKSKY